MNKICIYNDEIYNSVYHTQGSFFSNLSKVDPHKLTSDLLNETKAFNQADCLARYVKLNNKRVLEIGSGIGVNHIVWTKKYCIEGYGIEPDADGFESSYKISRALADLNDLDKERIIDATGEEIPFEKNIFDIVYSTNVLEHVQNPGKVFDEAFRVLKNGGTMQIVYPNYWSYFDGHYALFHPPIYFKSFFPWYVKNVWRRDPAFSKTLRTELNVSWTKRQLRRLERKYDFDVISYGEDIFKERMDKLNFGSWAGLTKIMKILKIADRLKVNKVLSVFFLFLRGWNPIILTLRKTGDIKNIK
jgi:SAM-dependent methyltransferase